MGKLAFLQANTGADVSFKNSKFSSVSSLASGSVLSAGYKKAKVSFSNSKFINNTAIYGGVFYAESQSKIICTNCSISGNFAGYGGVVRGENDGQFEFYSCNITNNNAYFASVSSMFAWQAASVYDNSMISNNYQLSKEEIKNNFLDKDYIKENFREYLINNDLIFEEFAISSAIHMIQSSLAIQNNTKITEQDKAIYSIFSTLSIDGLILSNSQISQSMIYVVECTFNAANINAYNISETKSDSLASVSYSKYALKTIIYENSTTHFLLSLYSDGTFENITVSNLECDYIMMIRSNIVALLSKLNITNIKTRELFAIRILDSNVTSIIDLTLSGINQTAIMVKDSEISAVYNSSFTNCLKAMDIESSSIGLVDNLLVSNCGSLSNLYSGGLYLVNSNIKIRNSKFFNNTASVGAAIYLDCALPHHWTTTIENSNFYGNEADIMGGAIYYNLYRPLFSTNQFNNSAPYGQNIASYPVRIVEPATNHNKIYLSNIGSGIKYDKMLTFAIVDYDNQTMNLENDSTIKIASTNQQSSIAGINSAKIKNGTAKFDNLEFISFPGSTNVKYSLTSNLLDSNKIKIGLDQYQYNSSQFENQLLVSFRFWKPGEIVRNENLCQSCQHGTYSLGWNSTECTNWMENAIWSGEAQIEVDSGYWRRTQNSTEIINCLVKESCKGGYHPENEYPVKCKKGYKGYLWASWDIVDGHKYQLDSNSQCGKCPNKIVNSIKVIWLTWLVLMFLGFIIVINIRKRKENQLSILLRIWTNYIHLITLAFSFGVDLPSTFTSIFSQTNKIGSPNDNMLSFDWFIEDYEIRAFAPSSRIFKLFILLLLPLILIALIFVIFGTMKLIIKMLKPAFKFDLKRYVAISTIWIIFLFHPTMMLESLRMFQWIRLDEGVSKMLIHMEFDWYSPEHLRWVMAIALPMLIVWVIGLPVVALIMLIKFRNSLENELVKKYLLLIYQGLKPKVFYWEFVNTLRKFVVLAIAVFLSSQSFNYRILTTMIFLVCFLRVQFYLKPYKLNDNNHVDLLGMLAAAITVYWSLLFIESNKTVNNFTIIWVIIMYFANIYFIIHWLYLFLSCLKIKHWLFIGFMKGFHILLCNKYQPLETQKDAASDNNLAAGESPVRVLL
jgi:hypothetical protein